MTTKFWKPFRVVVSILTLLALAFIFLDFRENLSSSWIRTITWLQFVPSFAKFLTAAGILSAGFLVVTLLTLIFGRVYCSLICPLGIIQDVISFFSKKVRRKKFRFKFSKAKNGFRYTFLALAVIPLFFGSVLMTGLLDPYSNFGRIFNNLFRPLYISSNNILAELLIRMKVYAISPQQLLPANWPAVIYALLILGALGVMASKWGRLYCNTVCPVGTLLGLLSRISFGKIRIDPSTCTKCAKCAVACKSQCINLKNQSVDFSRCVACFNCIHACQDNSIHYRFSFRRKHQEVKTTSTAVGPVKSGVPVAPANNDLTDVPVKDSMTDESKRRFIADSLVLTGAMLGISASLKASGEEDKLIPYKKEHPCTPPGSVSIRHFNNICTSCHLCISSCPGNVLRPSLLQYGLEGFLQPYMDPSSGYCNFDCTICGEVCPTGAILPLTVEQKQVTQVGVVHFIRENCVVYTDETLCGACSEHCPTKAVKMVPYKETLNIPHTEQELCIGCGACEHACPVVPYKAIYVEGQEVHQTAKKPEIKASQEEKLEEFPF